MIITEIDAYPIFKRIDALRIHAYEAETLTHQNELDKAVIDLDEELKRELLRRFGSENLRKHVPEWHKLVGSTPEHHGLPDEISDFVRMKIEAFVEAQEQKWGL